MEQMTGMAGTDRPPFANGRLLALLAALALAFCLTTTAHAQGQVHVVQPGENLFRIGLRYGVTVNDLMRANGLTSIYIYAGQKLVIPTGPVAAAPAAPAEAAPPQPAANAAPGGAGLPPRPARRDAVHHRAALQPALDADRFSQRPCRGSGVCRSTVVDPAG